MQDDAPAPMPCFAQRVSLRCVVQQEGLPDKGLSMSLCNDLCDLLEV